MIKYLCVVMVCGVDIKNNKLLYVVVVIIGSFANA